MWERWNSYSHEDGFGDAKMNSFNHYAYGAIGQWMYETVAGLKPDPEQPGYQHFYVAPEIGGDLQWAKASVETQNGKAASKWRIEGDSLVLIATVPEGSKATVVIPEGFRKRIVYQGRDLEGLTEMKVAEGVHTFVASR